jgi:DNA-binding NarL/FixJ family response regulator
MKYKIFVVDDHPIIREIYLQLIRRDATLEVIGQAATGEQALAGIGRLKPDLVLMDIGLPDLDGLEVMRLLLREQPTLSVLVISGQEQELYVERALASGAKGYMDKLGIATVLTTAIHAVLAGHVYIRVASRNKSATPTLPIG